MSKIVKNWGIPAGVLFIALIAVLYTVVDSVSLSFFSIGIVILYPAFVLAFYGIKEDLKTPFAIKHPVVFWFAKVGIVQIFVFGATLFILKSFDFVFEIERVGVYALFSLVYFVLSAIILGKVAREKRSCRS